jgi:hypothetical protein
MTQSIAYASARIDGVLDCKTMKIGILKTPTQSTPVVTFQVLAGLQRHPVWALDRLAAVVYCYCLAACIIASSIQWHTSKEIRGQAEAMIAAMTCSSPRWTDRWPFKDAMQMPIIRQP